MVELVLVLYALVDVVAPDEEAFASLLPPRPTSKLLGRPRIPAPPLLRDMNDTPMVTLRLNQLSHIVFRAPFSEPKNHYRRALIEFTKEAYSSELDVVSYFVWETEGWLTHRALTDRAPSMIPLGKLLDVGRVAARRGWYESDRPMWRGVEMTSGHRDLSRRWAVLAQAVRRKIVLGTLQNDRKQVLSQVKAHFPDGWGEAYSRVSAEYESISRAIAQRVADLHWVWDFWGDRSVGVPGL